MVKLLQHLYEHYMIVIFNIPLCALMDPLGLRWLWSKKKRTLSLYC